MPVSVIPDAVTVFDVPIAASENVAVPLTVKTSPAMRLSAYVTDATSLELYTLLVAVIVTESDRGVIVDVAVGAPTRLSE